MKQQESKLTKILLVKDKPLLLNRLEKMLQKEGYGVSSCSTVRDAIQLVKTSNYQAVATGIVFAGVSRVDIVPLIKIANPDIPVLIFSESKQGLQIIEAMDFGADDFVIALNDLPIRLKWVLKKKKESDEADLK